MFLTIDRLYTIKYSHLSLILFLEFRKWVLNKYVISQRKFGKLNYGNKIVGSFTGKLYSCFDANR